MMTIIYVCGAYLWLSIFTLLVRQAVIVARALRAFAKAGDRD